MNTKDVVPGNSKAIPEHVIEQLGQQIKTEHDLSAVVKQLTKQLVEQSLRAELGHHLEEEREEGKANSRNGYSAKTLKGDFGQMPIVVPRDRTGRFDPILIRKGQTRFSAFDEQILSLYARGMTTRDIAAMFQEIYGAEVSHSLISKVTDAVMDEVIAWQNRPLDAIYPIVYLDGIVVKVQQDKQVINKTLYLALGLNLEGKKELLGIWIAQTEGAKFWLSILTELQNRGVKDIYIACVDGLKGLPEAIETAYPNAKVPCTWCATVCDM